MKVKGAWYNGITDSMLPPSQKTKSIFDGIAPLPVIAQQRTRESRNTSRFPGAKNPSAPSSSDTNQVCAQLCACVYLDDMVPMPAARYQGPRPCV